MFHHKTTNQDGFTIVELVIVIVLTGIVTTILYTSSLTSINQYFNLQKDASAFSELAMQQQRLANVLRGLTDITEVNPNSITVYAYFFPQNAYASQIRYYLGDNNTKLYADVTPMTANPPLGTPITASKKTYVIMQNFYKPASSDLFTYLDASGNVLNLPISDQHSIKGLRLNLAVSSTAANQSSQSTIIQISLRNRKTNL